MDSVRSLYSLVSDVSVLPVFSFCASISRIALSYTPCTVLSIATTSTSFLLKSGPSVYGKPHDVFKAFVKFSAAVFPFVHRGVGFVLRPMLRILF